MTRIPSELLAQLFKAAEQTTQSVVELQLPKGGWLRYRRRTASEVSAQVEAEAEDGTVTILLRVFTSSPARPAEYPPSLPFIANAEVTINESEDAMVAVWKASDPVATFEELSRLSIEDGWAEEESEGGRRFGAVMGIRLVKFHRADRSRALTSAQWPAPFVSLVDGADRNEMERHSFGEFLTPIPK